MEIILEHFRSLQPRFRRGHAVVCADGTELGMVTACAAPTSALIARLADAADAPRYHGGGVNRNALPRFFATWAKVAWGDLVASLPDEDTAQLGASEPPAEELRRMVREAMLSEVVLGDVIGKSGVTQTERRSLIQWCERFAKVGPWRRIRSKCCWCKLVEDPDGEVVLRVALRHELFSQTAGVDRRLRDMGAKAFTRRAARYGVGTSHRNDRPHGLAAIVLADEFVQDLIADLPEDDL